MKKIIQTSIQVIFLILFILLTILNRIQIWMGIFVIFGIFGTLIFSRFYCGWICPINTGIKVANWIKNKLHIGSFKTPDFLKKAWVRYIALAFFAILLAMTFITGEKLPVLPALVIIGVILSIFFHESLWHRHLCPYGTLLSLPGHASKKYLKIDNNACISCGKCKAVCPSEAVKNEATQYDIIKHECLVCMACVEACPKNIISFFGNR